MDNKEKVRFFKRIGRKVREKIEDVGTYLGNKYSMAATVYFKKKAVHAQNLIDRMKYNKPMLRDFPKYIGKGLYSGFSLLFNEISSVLSDWRMARDLAEYCKIEN